MSSPPPSTPSSPTFGAQINFCVNKAMSIIRKEVVKQGNGKNGVIVISKTGVRNINRVFGLMESYYKQLNYSLLDTIEKEFRPTHIAYSTDRESKLASLAFHWEILEQKSGKEEKETANR